MFHVGEWVEFTEWVYGRKVKKFAYIIEYPNDVNVRIYVPKDGRDRYALKINLESIERVLPEVKTAAKNIFMEMALMTRDKDWFMEVSG